MKREQLLAISTKPLETKHRKAKLAWPGYRELLNLDKQKTQKIESDDENENYLEKLLRREQEAKKLHQEESRKQRIEEQKNRKLLEKQKRMLQKLERKRMIEDGLIDPNDPAHQQFMEEEPSEESVLEPVKTVPAEQESPVMNPTQQQKTKKTQASRSLSKSVSQIHEKRCKTGQKFKRSVPLQPYIITGGLYLTEKKAIPHQYEKFIERLKYKTVQPESPRVEPESPSRPTTQRLNPERLQALSKPKSASTTRLKDFAWGDSHHSKKDEDKLDFNFVVRAKQPQLRRKNTFQRKGELSTPKQPSSKMTVSQLFLRKMFVSTTDEQMFKTDLATKRRTRR